MKKIFLISLLLFFCLQADLLAQKKIENQLSLALGMSHLKRQDLIFSPFVHQDLSLMQIGINYQRNSRLIQSIDLQLGLFAPGYQTPYKYEEEEDVKTATNDLFIFMNLDYRIGKYLVKHEKFNLEAGAALITKVQALNYVYGRIGNFGYHSTIGLGGYVNGSYQLNEKQKLSMGLQLPLLSWLARSPFSINDDEYIENTTQNSGIGTFFAFLADGQLASWDKLQYLDFDFHYEYLLNQKWLLKGQYGFSFIHVQVQRPMTSLQNNFNIIGTLKF